MDPVKWPAWRYGPNGAAAIFQQEAEVPAGWADHPAKVKADPLDHDGDGRKGGSKPRKKAVNPK